MNRLDKRLHDQIRPVRIEAGAQRFPEGSIIYRCGQTTLLISASIEDGVRDFLRGSGRGWVTAEYAMHPRANPERKERDGRRGRMDGRSQEIQRLIGRALRASVVPEKLGERTITLDCDVLDADGGTRTAAITGGFVALAMALDRLCKDGLIAPGAMRAPTAAVSVGLVQNQALLDLCYKEDSTAQVDLNVVATHEGDIIELQGSSEEAPIARTRFDQLVDLALQGIKELCQLQQKALNESGVNLERLFGP